MKKLIFILLAILIITGCGKPDQKSAPEDRMPLVTVEVATVFSGYLNNDRPVSGILKSFSDAIVSSEASGNVRKINIDESQPVGKDGVVVSLDSTILLSRLELAEASYNQAFAAYELALDPYRPEDLAKARAAYEAAKTAYDVAKTDYERNKGLFQEGVISQQQLDMSRQAFEAANAQLVSARETLNTMESGLRPEEIEQAKAGLQSAEANLALARTNYSNAFIKSPFDGMVAEVFVDEGELVGPGTPVSGLSIQRISILKPGFRISTSPDLMQVRRWKSPSTRLSVILSTGNCHISQMLLTR